MYRKSLILLVIPLAVLFVSCGSSQQNAKEAKYKDDYRAIINIMDNGNVDGLDAYIAQDAVEHQTDSSVTTKPGLAGIKDIFRYYHKIFPDLKTTIHSIAVSGDTLFGYISSTGIASEPFMGMPAGHHMTSSTVDLIVFNKENKMQEHWGFLNSNEVTNMMKVMQEKAAVGMKKK